MTKLVEESKAGFTRVIAGARTQLLRSGTEKKDEWGRRRARGLKERESQTSRSEAQIWTQTRG